jgi:hypothetical protein
VVGGNLRLGRLRGRSHLFTQNVPVLHIIAAGFWCGRMDRGTLSLPIGGGGVVGGNLRLFERSESAVANSLLKL